MPKITHDMVNKLYNWEDKKRKNCFKKTTYAKLLLVSIQPGVLPTFCKYIIDRVNNPHNFNMR